jgi:hypothetical protein
MPLRLQAGIGEICQKMKLFNLYMGRFYIVICLSIADEISYSRLLRNRNRLIGPRVVLGAED